MYNIAFYFLLYIIYSMIGWLLEVVWTFITDKKLVNRGFLIGPYCPIYGTGCILMILLLQKYSDDILVLFIMSMLICSILEYATSYFMEKIFKARWWDYSNRKFNINGRICLETLIPFGILGCVLIYALNPFVSKLIKAIPSNILIIISGIVFIAFLIDNIVSFKVISKIKVSSQKLIEDNTEEITKKVREYISKYSKSGKRLMQSFPNIKILKERFKVKRKNNIDK